MDKSSFIDRDVIRIHVPQEEIEARRTLMSDCMRLRNRRAPAIIFADPPFYTKVGGIRLQDTYDSPEVMIRGQLLGWKRILETIDCDVPGVGVGLEFGSFLSASNYGCEVVEQPGSVPGWRPWFRGEEDLAKLERIDSHTSGVQGRAVEFYHRYQELADRFPVQYDGGEVFCPVRETRLGTSTEGAFTVACMIAGFEQVSLWCYDQPSLVKRMVEIIAQKEIERIQDAFRIMGERPSPIGMADDYSPYLSLAMYEEFVLPYQKIVRDAFGSTTGFHSCIGDPKLLRHWRDDLRITVFNGFKPRRGLASLREDYTPVAREMSGRLVLEPDLDGCKVMVASEDDLKRAVEECLEVFGPAKGIKICATLCGGHHVDDMQKMNVIKKTILASAV